MTEIGMALGNPLDTSRRKEGSVGVPFAEVQTKVLSILLKSHRLSE